jgi:hypothetical protein
MPNLNVLTLKSICLEMDLTRIPAYITEEKEKQPLASRPKRTTGKHHKKRDHLCCRWTDELGEQYNAAQIRMILEQGGGGGGG